MVYDHPPYLNAHFYNNMIFYEDHRRNREVSRNVLSNS